MPNSDKNKRLDYINQKIFFIEKEQRRCANEVYKAGRDPDFAKKEIAEHQKILDAFVIEHQNILLDKQTEFSSESEEILFQEKRKEEALEKEAETISKRDQLHAKMKAAEEKAKEDRQQNKEKDRGIPDLSDDYFDL